MYDRQSDLRHSSLAISHLKGQSGAIPSFDIRQSTFVIPLPGQYIIGKFIDTFQRLFYQHLKVDGFQSQPVGD